jgi:hypothetical protein
MGKYFNAFIMAIITFFSPIAGLLLAVGAMIALDTILGVTKAIKLEGWESVTSRRASVIISKFLLYQLTVITFFIIDYNLINEFTKAHYQNDYLLTKFITLSLCFVEAKSIDENIKVIFGFSIWTNLKEVLTRTQELKKTTKTLKK